MSKKHRIYQTGYTTNSILIYLDPNKQYYLIMDSSKHSWSGILVQNAEQTKDDELKYHT